MSSVGGDQREFSLFQWHSLVFFSAVSACSAVNSQESRPGKRAVAQELHQPRFLEILRNFRIHGDDLWLQFKGGRDGTIWYYRAVVGALSEAATPEEQQLNALIEEISDTLSLLEEALADRSMQIRPAELA